MKKNIEFALITGGSSGIGFALAKQLVERGVDVLIVARNEERLEKAKEALNGVRTRKDQ